MRINRFWFHRNRWRIALAAAIGVIAFIVTLPAEARLPVGPIETPVYEPAMATCELRVKDLDESRLVHAVEIEGSTAIDLVLVFYVEEMDEFVTVTALRGCVKDIR